MMDFSQLNKKFAQNFNAQKAILKKLLQGKARQLTVLVVTNLLV